MVINHKKHDIINVEIINKKQIILLPKAICIIISAYDCAEYIEECLDGVQAQSYKNYRILLGIDGCKKTLEKVKEIRHKYDNLSLYYNRSNAGVYKMFNSLASLANDDEYLLFFGADDIMNPDMLKILYKYNQHTISKHVGVLFISVCTFKTIGGFRGWRCGADSDMIYRLRLLTGKRELVEKQLFFRRVHDKQLTTMSKTGICSEYRKKLNKIMIDNYKSENPLIYIKPKKVKLIKL